MATSGSVDWTLTRNDIIRSAARKIQAVRSNQQMGTAMMEDFNKALNAMVKHWQATPGLHVWTVTEGTLFPQANQIQYAMSDAATSAHATQSFVQTEISADEAAGQTVISVADTDGISNADKIGVTLDDGTIHWTTVSGAPTTTITIAAALTDSASAGNFVYAYTSRMVRPLRIVAARTFDPETEEESPIQVIARKDYQTLSNKTLAGTINQLFYDPKLTTGQLHLYQPLSIVNRLVKFTWWRPIEDFDAAGDNPDLPQEWIQTLIFNLAMVMAPEFDVPAEKFNQIVTMATAFKDEIMGFDREAESIQFAPGEDDE